ncbi:MAG: hypothetical protein HQM10_11705 [Candidatus Riflebacteria bacterium]|nr:hypothetical protein [Candidatus Riflebacteria bacterium]
MNITDYFSSIILGPAYNRRKILYIFSLLITAFLGWLAVTNKFEYELKDLMGDRPDLLEKYHESIRTFGPDDQIMIAIPIESLSIKALSIVFKIRRKIEALCGVQSVYDSARAIGIEDDNKISWLEMRPRYLRRMIERLRTSSFSRGFLISSDEKAQALFINLKQLSAVESHNLVRSLRKLLNAEIGENKWYMSGYPVFAERYVSRLITENSRFILLSFCSSLILAFFLFRSVRITLAILFCVMLPTIWTHGIFALLGYKISIFSSLLTPIIMFIALSLSIQFINKFIYIRNVQLMHERCDFRSISLAALKENLPAGLLCAATTTGGFISQVFSPIQGIRAFSIFSALGCGLAFFLVYIFLPIILSGLPKTEIKTDDLIENYSERKVGRFLLRWLPSPFIILVSALIFTAVTGSGCFFLKYGKEPLEAFPENDSLVTANKFVQSNFLIGSRMVSFILESKHESFASINSFLTISKFHAAVASDPEVVSFSSPSLLVEEICGELTGSHPFFPKNQAELECALRIATAKMPVLTASLLNIPYLDQARITVNLKHGDSVSVEETVRRIQKAAASIGGNMIHVSATGRLYLSAIVENEALKIQIASMSTSVIGIFLLIGLAFKSWRALWISFLVNILPIISSLGVMGWLGVHIEPATAMGPCICLGTIVDDTIHVLYAFFRDESKDHSPATCRIRIMINYSWAIVSVSIIPILGLGILCLSDFGPTKNFGLFSAMTLLIGLFYDLLLTCSLLAVSGKTIRQKDLIKTNTNTDS